MRRFLLWSAVAAATAFTVAAAAATAQGKFTVDRSTTRTLTHAYAVEKGALTKIVLASGPVEEAELFSEDALQSAVSARNLSALVIELDEGRPTFFFDQKLPAGLEVRTVTTFKPKKSPKGTLAGRVTMADPDFSFSFDATFDAAIVVQPEGAEPVVEATPENIRRAVLDGDADAVKRFLAAGMSDEAGNALRLAVDQGHADVVKLLLEHGGDKNSKDAYGQSLLMTASSSHRVDVVALLIAAGADVNAPNQYRITPLAVAAEQGHLDLVNMLVEAGANVNARDTAGGTALSVAILRGYQEIVARLIEAGTDLQRDKEDLLMLAADKPEIKAMLEEAMAKQ